ncbi:hypothetical protein FKP32DRAFT_1554326, partial [Trametes sanguinea]
VSFSPDGALLASSDLSGKMCIWEALTGHLLHVYTAGTSIVSLAWDHSDVIMCGLMDGIIVKLILTDEEVEIEGKWSHAYPVENLAVYGCDLLASGAHSEVFVWDTSENWKSSLPIKELEPPMVADTNREVLVTGLHWGATDGHRRSPDILVVTYMSQGIFIYDANDWVVLRHIVDRADAGFILSPDCSHIAVANLVDGFDIYDLETGSVALSLFHEVGKKYPVPVLYVHGGTAILGGSTAGMMDLWYIE